jgi:hypothetical protein
VNTKSLNRKHGAVLAVAVICGYALMFWLCARTQGCRESHIVAYADTVKSLLLTASAVMEFWTLHGQLPADLSRLEDPSGAGLSRYAMRDGWKRDVMYKRETDQRAALVSYGRDGARGGSGLDGDWRLVIVASQAPYSNSAPRMFVQRTPLPIAELRQYLKQTPFAPLFDEATDPRR